MKKAKLLKIVSSIFVSAALAAATAVSSFAYDLTITGTKTGHTYGAYQIFTGDLDEKGTLSNIEWGTGVNGTAALTALKADGKIGSLFTDADSAATVAKAIEKATAEQMDVFAQVIGTNLTATAVTKESSDSSTVINGLDAGYYLIKDTKKVDGQDAATKFIIKIIKDATATPKTGVPTVEKKLQDNDDGVADAWQDVADYDIGESVPFKLTGTMPSNISDYKTYKYIFHDTLSAGLTFNNDVTVKVGETTIDASKYTVTANGTSIDISFTDVKTLGVDITADSKIVVEYSAKVNADAVVGLSGNPNEVYLEFSNNPNQGGEGETGNTPPDKVVVFTYELDVLKVDGANTETKLKDAEFKLSHNGKWLVVENGKVKEWVDSEDDATTLKTDANGKIAIIGLDEGTYSLKETKAPSGYNKIATPIELVITADDVHDLEYTGSNAADELTAIKLNGAAGDVTSGIVETQVENNQGSQLPETGGIGTTIFYIGGGILAVAAALLLVVKIRKRNEA